MSRIIKINIGGVLYQTTKNTLSKDQNSMLASMFSGRHPIQPDENGYHFIDRDGKIFEYIIKFLRDDKINLDDVPKNIIKNIMDEAEYYNMTSLLTFLQKHITPEYDNIGNGEYVLQKVFSMRNIDIEKFEIFFKEVYSLDNLIKSKNGGTSSEYCNDHFLVYVRKNEPIKSYDFYDFLVVSLCEYKDLYFSHNSKKGTFTPFKSIQCVDSSSSYMRIRFNI